MEQDKVSMFQAFFPNIEENELRQMSYEAIDLEKAKIIDSKIVDEEMGILLEIFVSRFIVLHELGHILNGHCKLLADLEQKKTCFISMYYNEKEKPVDDKEALRKRTMEMDADAFAATQSMLHAVFLYDNLEKEVKVSNIKPQDIFYWWAFAIRSHFLMCEDKFMDYNYCKKMTHLPSAARWTLIYSTVIELIDMFNKNKKEIENLKISIDKGTMDAEFKFNKLKFSTYSLINEIYDNKVSKAYIDEVHHNWEAIKDQLERYTRLPLYESRMKLSLKSKDGNVSKFTYI